MKIATLGLIALMMASCTERIAPNILVQGTSTIEVPVEFYKVTLEVTSESDTMQKAEEDIYIKSIKILDMFENYKIDKSTIQTERATGDKDKYNNRNNEKVTWVFKQSYTVVLGNGVLLEDFRKSAVENGVTSFDVTGKGNYNEIEYRRKALTLAYAAAVRKAQLLVNGTGVTVGRPIKINDGKAYDHQFVEKEINIPQQKEYFLSAQSRGRTTVPDKTYKIDASVNVAFELQ